ncbi:hypothetical protein [Paraburkholderia diazotrophica]|uniref:Uncharacterized protein n=1 Tax=Paraburkholderia diazotrophica TaxID=667676 RepID=A0A1H7E0M2_9BURK|nr:hypothetical protein [Paraburkholderia diazotrophica]SEK07224.1 hypothetical protein SAMN05192539_103817 [Paraburkholderia diazotrophica]
MSMNLAAFYRHAVFEPFEAVRHRLHAKPRRVAVRQKETHHKDTHDKDTQDRPTPCDDAERLERIAAYARAGYFNMGYTLDMFYVIGEIEPE